MAKKNNYYIDPVELRKELTHLATTFKEETVAMIKDRESSDEYIQTIIDAKNEFSKKKITKKKLLKLIEEKEDKKGGKKHSDEYKDSINKLAESMKGKHLTIKQVDKLSNAYASEQLRIDCEKKCTGEITEELGVMFLNLVDGMSNKRNWIKYTYKEDLKGLGLEFLCKYTKRFDPDNPKSNAFAYCSQICNNGFLQALEKEKKQGILKDALIKRSMECSEKDKWLRDNDDRFSGAKELDGLE